MSGLLRRVGAFLLEPSEPVTAPPPTEPAPAQAGAAAPVVRAATRAAILGAPPHVPAIAGACAGELRARAGSPAALVCLWRPGPAPPEPGDEDAAEGAGSPAGATTPAARRLAASLVHQGLAATACGRLAWLALPADPVRAVADVRRALGTAGVPAVLAVAGPRPAALEPVLAVADLGLAVLPADTEPALRDLAVAHRPGAQRCVVAPLAPGPPRWAALAGLARLRSLPATEGT